MLRVVAFFTLAFGIIAPSLMAQETLTNEGVIKMVKAGLGDGIVISMIETQPANLSLTADRLIALKEAGVSDAVIAAMVKKSAGGGGPAQQLGETVAASFKKPPVAEIGVYYRDATEWVEIRPEVVNWKTGGVLKSVATVGVVKGNVNGRLHTPHSSTRLVTPVEILIYTPEGVSVAEYQLIKFREKKKAREFRTVTGGVFHASGGAQRDLVRYKSKKLAPRTYSITLSALESGEYGFLPPGLQGSSSASAQLGKMYTFHLQE